MSEVRVIYGPPGTGKTTRLLELLDKELSSGVKADRIAFVSFTQEGANQGRDRALAKFGGAREDFPYFRTLHSIAFRAMGINRSMVMSGARFKDFSRQMGMRFLGYYTDDMKHNDDRYLFFDELYRNNRNAALPFLDELDVDTLKFVRMNYRKYKDFFTLYDYTDMIEAFVQAKQALPVDVAFIDEAQDLTTLQWLMVWVAVRKCRRVYIAGDDDQAIFSWSGADVNYFLDVKPTAPPEILGHSWRLPDDILAFAKRITSQISRRADKPYTGRGVNGGIFTVNDVSEVTIDPKETYMFLARNNKFLDAIEDTMRKQGILYTRGDKLSVSRDEIRTIKEWEEGRKGGVQFPEGSFVREQLRPDATRDTAWYDALDWEQEKLDYYRDVMKAKTDLSKQPNVKISTFHTVKGAEADNVIVLLDMAKRTWDHLMRDPDSEHRAFYVAVTRARKTLTIVMPSTKHFYPIFPDQKKEKRNGK